MAARGAANEIAICRYRPPPTEFTAVAEQPDPEKAGLVSITTDRKARLFKRDSQVPGARLFRRLTGSSAVPVKQAESDVDTATRETRDRWLTYARWVAVSSWAVVVVYRTVTEGLAFNRELLLLYIATGLIAASIGRGRKVFAVVCDWLPFALFLLLYDLSRGATALLGAPTLWKFQVDADRWLFSGPSRRSGCRSTSRWRNHPGGK